ncbi:MAG TPA: M56 family metallopeptidase [Candidatus Avoscillospira avicola]|uniref:M56 family metallopeptidase n=1 Tax=Candidatus Avoscillospira avicola TaxID=2840706 RepID=A0A9D1DH62_9FIRM|nr:M56 family metallopeptidase [Candidatus Avoscillospira avicola]
MNFSGWYRVLLSAVLAGGIVVTFRQSWRREHVESAPLGIGCKPQVLETAVWFPPTVILWAQLLLLLLLAALWSPAQAVQAMTSQALDMALHLSAWFLALTAAMPLLRRRFRARTCAILWLLPAIAQYFCLLPPKQPLPRWSIYVPQPALRWLLGLWGAGAAAVLGWYCLSHGWFCLRLRRSRRPETDEAVTALWRRELERAGYRSVRLFRTGAVSAPLSLGFTRWTRATVLPEQPYTEAELSWIFRHEIRHLQRGDVSTKFFLAFANACCWWNPLVWLATRRAAEDLELSCDELVLEGADQAQRKAYAALLLRAAGPRQAFTTCLSGAAATLRYRLKRVLEPGARSLGLGLLAVAMFLCTLSCGLVSFSDSRGSLTALALTPEAAVTSATIFTANEGPEEFRGFTHDTAALYAYFDTLPAERLLQSAGDRDPGDGRSLELYLDTAWGWETITLTDRGAVRQTYVRTEDRHEKAVTSYRLLAPLDWAEIEACLLPDEAEAEVPPMDVTVTVSLTVGDGVDGPVKLKPVEAAATSEAGDVLWATGHSDHALELYAAEEGTLLLDFPQQPDQFNLTVTGADGQTVQSLSGASRSVSVPAPVGSALRLEVTYPLEDGGVCEATYQLRISPME